MTKLSVWYDGDSEWVIAHSAEDADKILEEHLGPNHGIEAEWEALPDNAGIPIRIEAYSAKKLGLEVTNEQVLSGEEVRFARTCAEWCAISGRGHLCSTEY